MIFRQLFDPASCTYTYLLGDRDEALLIDPVFEQAPRDLALLDELGLKLLATLDTHVHADHVTGAWWLHERCGSRIALASVAGAMFSDLPLGHGDRIRFGRRYLEVRATPGHTNGCLTYVLDGQHMAFTGDSLLIRGCGRTDFQQGSPLQLFRSVHEQILTLPDECLLYPAHDYRGITVTSVGEERRFNPRLGGEADAHDFVGYMDNLNLPHPKLMAQAVPANLRSGKPEDARLPAGYAIELAGAAADSSKAQDSIAANVPLVIFIIFTLLMLQLHSFSRAMLVFLTGPLGVAGAAVALLVLHRPFGFVAQLGVIALFGMIIRNSVILIASSCCRAGRRYRTPCSSA
ncbi:efflux RND transporter permease subunit [Herbaspirillum lusitanum]|uniref:efflux RND transporter permease subunit n=1 Tax=Herbaspirillum lusitanum TaxID=213312 RepID=UPI0002E30940|nr:efflux RND transporter permease subunit [Herbaspirillum lusitanum]